jgi:hypothetical protein
LIQITGCSSPDDARDRAENFFKNFEIDYHHQIKTVNPSRLEAPGLRSPLRAHQCLIGPRLCLRRQIHHRRSSGLLLSMRKYYPSPMMTQPRLRRRKSWQRTVSD